MSRYTFLVGYLMEEEGTNDTICHQPTPHIHFQCVPVMLQHKKKVLRFPHLAAVPTDFTLHAEGCQIHMLLHHIISPMQAFTLYYFIN